jgi:hypothetical protein
VQFVDFGRPRIAQIDGIGLLIGERLVLREPTVDDLGQSIGLARFALAAVGLIGPANVVTNGALGHAESLGNVLDCPFFVRTFRVTISSGLSWRAIGMPSLT